MALMSRDEICEALGIAPSTLTLWQRHGCPTVRHGRGRGQKSLFNIDGVKAWMEQSGRGFAASIFMRRERQAQQAETKREAARARDERLLRSVPHAVDLVGRLLDLAFLPWVAAMARQHVVEAPVAVAQFHVLATAVNWYAGEVLGDAALNESKWPERLTIDEYSSDEEWLRLRREVLQAIAKPDGVVRYLEARISREPGFARETHGPPPG